jgi:hypothetical protein
VTSVTLLSSERAYALGQMAPEVRHSGRTIASTHTLVEKNDRYSDSCKSVKAMLEEKSADWNERGHSCI